MRRTSQAAHSGGPPTAARRARGGRWIEHWDPEDEAFWERSGRRIARRNLALSIFAEHLGFSIWVLWTIVVINLGRAGFTLTLAEQFWLTAVPNLIGAGLRIPYTIAVARFGGRAWTTFSAALLLVPALLLAFVVPSGWLAGQSPDAQFWILLACAATAGVGGGNFASSMANISFFYPERRKGFALGLNAAGGNLGVAFTQIAVPLVIVAGVPTAAARMPEHEVHLAYAGLMWIPLVVIAALGAYLFMDSIAEASFDHRSHRAALRSAHTWILSVLYIGTFGSFIGLSFALPLVIKNTFPEFLREHPYIATYLAGLAFVGALVGSVTRPLGGWLSDRWGGARVTIGVFLGMGVFTGVAIAGVREHSFPLFLASFVAVFALAGAGNGSVYRMIPSIFAALGRREVEERGRGASATLLDYRRRAAAVLGITGAIGAFGGFLVQFAFRQSALDVSRLVEAAGTPAERLAVAEAHADWSVPALCAFIVAYAVCAAITWFFYLRKSFAVDRVPSLRYASI